jgi:hypothetical protein
MSTMNTAPTSSAISRKRLKSQGVSRAAGDDQLRLVGAGNLGHFVHVDALGVRLHGVRRRLEPQAGLVDRRAVRQVSARCEVEAHEHVAGLEERQEYGLVGLRAGRRLDVGKAAAEQLLGAFDGQRFGDIDEVAAAVVALAGIAFGVFVGEYRTGGFKHGSADDVFRGDQLDLVLLAAEFLGDAVIELGVALTQRLREERICGGGFRHWWILGRLPWGSGQLRARCW